MASEKEITAMMEKLHCSKEEAEDVIKWDKAIDHGERTPFDLDPEKEKAAKKFANSTTKKRPPNYSLEGAKPRQTRKENPTKAAIIAEIATFLTENSENACENVEITNKERQISFKIGSESYELTLVQKRKPKS